MFCFCYYIEIDVYGNKRKNPIYLEGEKESVKVTVLLTTKLSNTLLALYKHVGIRNLGGKCLPTSQSINMCGGMTKDNC